MPNNNSAVAQKLITKCSWWSNVKLYGLTEPMRCKNEKWNDFIKLVANNEVDNLKWNDIEDIKITRSQTEAEKFYLEGYEMSDNFPLDRQWICPTNNYAKEMNQRFHSLRKNNIHT